MNYPTTPVQSQYTRPPPSSCDEVTVHRALFPVSHGTGSTTGFMDKWEVWEEGQWLTARKPHERGRTLVGCWLRRGFGLYHIEWKYMVPRTKRHFFW